MRYRVTCKTCGNPNVYIPKKVMEQKIRWELSNMCRACGDIYIKYPFNPVWNRVVNRIRARWYPGIALDDRTRATDIKRKARMKK